MRIRYCPHGCELNPIVRGPSDHEHLDRSSIYRHEAQSPPLPFLFVPGRRLLDYCKVEPLGGFLLRRPLTRARCGGGIALSHLRAGCSTVSAGGTAHARGACVLGARVDRRTAAGWAGAPSGCWPEREG